MNIDFAPPSNGTYNNAGSCRQLANYMEHEDLERMEKGIYIDGFFNLTEDNIYKSNVIRDIDSNIGQLLKTDAKFYAIHISPSEKELRAIGNTEQEQAEAMKHYIREVFIPEYANNFNKELFASDIKFYGKIHFDRSRSDNELNMHCHLIVSRKDQTNKKKLSPLTNHKNTKNGIIKNGFERVNLIQHVEQGFDKLFNYNRQPTESFDYRNTMKNDTIFVRLNLQGQELQSSERKVEANQKDLFSTNLKNTKKDNQAFNVTNKIDRDNHDHTSNNQAVNQENNISSYTIFLSNLDTPEEKMPSSKKKNKKTPKM